MLAVRLPAMKHTARVYIFVIPAGCVGEQVLRDNPVAKHPGDVRRRHDGPVRWAVYMFERRH